MSRIVCSPGATSSIFGSELTTIDAVATSPWTPPASRALSPRKSSYAITVRLDSAHSPVALAFFSRLATMRKLSTFCAACGSKVIRYVHEAT